MRVEQFKSLMQRGTSISPAAYNPGPMALRDSSGRVVRSIYDAPQSGLSFVVGQATYIEREVNRIMYPDIQYPALVPVDTSAPEWAPSVTYFSHDMTGKAAFIDSFAQDIPNADVKHEKFKQAIYMAAIGYGYSLEEIGQAQLLGMSLPVEKAQAARRAYEEFMDNIVIRGDSTVGFQGLINNSAVTPQNVADNAAASSKLWTAKTPDEILADLNEPLIDTHNVSNTVELADTLLLGVARYNYIATRPRSSQSDTTILEYFRNNNTYTSQTGQPLMVRTLRGLETAGAAGTQRMISYRRSPEVLKMHVPMVHRFLPPFQKSALYVEVPGIFRLGGLDFRRPGAIRYRDGF